MQRISSGSPYEVKSGYSRAVIANGFVFISATAATDNDGKIVGKNDFYTQTKVILEKLKAVLVEAGSSINSVAQTRVYTVDVGEWENIGKAHAEIFGQERPAMSLVHVKPFLDADMLVEIELVAVVT